MLYRIFTIMRDKLGFAPKPALNSVDALVRYSEEQAAYVSQVTLYTYIKTRAGTQWPKLFSNDTYLTSLKTARWHIFGACVSDLALYIAARCFRDGACQAQTADMLASHIIGAILDGYSQDDIDASAFLDMAQAGRQRASATSWAEAADQPLTFQSSADAFMRWAPVADEFKELDEEIMRNSMHLRWIGIRRDVKERLDYSSVLSEVGQRPQGLSR